MENPDTVIEFHRTVVEEIFVRVRDHPEPPVPPPPPQPFTGPLGIAGQAHIMTSVARVWFHNDGSGRRWRDESNPAELDRHLAFELRLDGHPTDLGLEDSRLVFTSLGAVPVPSGGTHTCNGRTYRSNEIPIFGRLVVHDSIERVDLTIDGRAHHDLVLDFSQQQGPALRGGQPTTAPTARLFGPDVQTLAGGEVRLIGTEPHVTWELTQAQESCIRQSPIGTLMAGPLIGQDPITLIAEKLVAGAKDTLATAGKDSTSVASLLPAPHPVDPTGASGDPFAIDGVVRPWTRAGNPAEQESLQIQIKTVDPHPVPLPPSVLALSTDETVGFMRSDWALLRSIRASQIRALCISESDFDPDVGCRLITQPTIDLGDNEADLVEFSAEVVHVPALGHDVIDIKGRAENNAWYAEWFIEFGMHFDLGRGDVPRDPLNGELPPNLQPTRTLAEMNKRLRELTDEKCAGGSIDDIEEEREQIATEKLMLPSEIGIKPLLFGEPHRDSDFSWTTAGIIFGVALLVAASVLSGGIAAFAGAKLATAVWITIGVFLGGTLLVVGGGAILDNLVYDKKVSDGLRDFIQDKSAQDGEQLPLEGHSPTLVLLDDGFLRVFMAPLPARLAARFVDPDERSPGDLDRTSQRLAGLLEDGRMWQLSIADAAYLVEKGRIAIDIDAAVSGTGQSVPLHVARSARGRRYLRTPPGDVGAVNLRDLPRVPAD